MKYIFKLLFLLTFAQFGFSQDTTWVQTFTFDSISTRRAEFSFPSELEGKRFEKVLMYYKLKCDPQTPWDSYNCGEWDYLTYTRIFDHTGVMDSVKRDSLRYLNNYQNSPVYNYDSWGTNRQDVLVRQENMRSGATLTTNSVIGTGASVGKSPFDVTRNGGRFQMLISASELIASGVVPGNIESLALYLDSYMGSGELNYPTVSLKGTSDLMITSLHTSGFTEVYNLSRSLSGFAPEFVIGENELLFHTPFVWNGTDNIIVEFKFEQSLASVNDLQFTTENSLPGLGVKYEGKNGVLNFTGTQHALLELSDIDLGNEVTIAFWSKGQGNTGVNTSILEGYDTLNQRVINIHMPWSDNTMYWDCGAGSGYDRINKSMASAGIDNEWHHWAFIKNQTTGEMKIMRDGVLWHSGTGLTRSIGELHRLVLGSNRNLANNWKGKIDEFQIYNVALDEATITNWFNSKIDNTHPNWSDLLVYYDFDDEQFAIDKSSNNNLLMPSSKGLFDFSESPVAGVLMDENRPIIAFGTGAVSGSNSMVEVPLIQLLEPEVVFEFTPVNNHFEIVNSFVAIPEGTETIYDVAGAVVSSTPFSGGLSYSNEVVTYYEKAFEIINDVEIGRFITPYGISFDLGSQGFNWIYDVTDYQMYLKGMVDLAAHNTQELIDCKFAFIEGIPPRDVHSREPIWSDFKSYTYSSMDNDSQLSAKSITLSDTSEMFKIKTRFTGHGHNGSVNCCEWDSKDHMISIDGVERFNWEIWEETACGDNPNVSQGGTWPYAREGWCPGDLVKEYDHELTPYVNSGADVVFDYDIEDIPVNDAAQGNGNYIVAMDLISYSAPNFQNDAAIVDILNPNNWEYYGKWNPSCQNPRVIIQNTGAQDLTSCRISIWVDWNHKIEYNWTGNLKFLEKEIVEIPVNDYSFWYDYSNGGKFTAHVNYIQSTWGLDEYSQNNEKTVAFEAPKGINGPFLVWFNTNNKAFENKWRLTNGQGDVIFERTSLANSTAYKDTFDLAPGCYSIILEDSDNDGISFWYSAQTEGETGGAFRIKLVGGTIVETFESDFGNYHQFNFTVGFDLGIDDLGDIEEEISIYPNPNNGNFDVEISGNIDYEATLQVIDIMGREVAKEKMNAKLDFAHAKLNLDGIPSGHYIVKIQTANGIYTKEFVKQ